MREFVLIDLEHQIDHLFSHAFHGGIEFLGHLAAFPAPLQSGD